MYLVYYKCDIRYCSQCKNRNPCEIYYVLLFFFNLMYNILWYSNLQ